LGYCSRVLGHGDQEKLVRRAMSHQHRKRSHLWSARGRSCLRAP
jgi:hypothetical protein